MRLTVYSQTGLLALNESWSSPFSWVIEIIRCASMTGASPHSGQATVTVAVGLSRSLSATIITLTPHLQRQADTIVITVPQILRGGHITSKHFFAARRQSCRWRRKMGHYREPTFRDRRVPSRNQPNRPARLPARRARYLKPRKSPANVAIMSVPLGPTR
jgi:hypothetical protein